MIQPRSLPSALYTLLVLIACTCSCYSQPEGSEPPFRIPSQYSVVVTLKVGEKPKAAALVSRIYVDKNKLRTEVETPFGTAVVIHRGDLAKTYRLKDSVMAYSEEPYSQSSNPFMGRYPNGKWKKLEPEVLDGVQMERYQLTTSQSSYEYWVEPSTHMFTRIVFTGVKGSGIYECSNFKAGGQPAALFELPENYRQEEKKQTPPTDVTPKTESI